MKKINFNPFEIIYVAISIATMQHTVWSSSFIFEGALPITPAERVWWIFNGILIALTIDIGMFLTARQLRKQFSIAAFIAFIIAAVASFYMQLIYASFHTGNFEFGIGVASQWLNFLKPFIEARVIILPLILPLFAVIYTFSNREMRSISASPSTTTKRKYRKRNKNVPLDSDK